MALETSAVAVNQSGDTSNEPVPKDKQNIAAPQIKELSRLHLRHEFEKKYADKVALASANKPSNVNPKGKSVEDGGGYVGGFGGGFGGGVAVGGGGGGGGGGRIGRPGAAVLVVPKKAHVNISNRKQSSTGLMRCCGFLFIIVGIGIAVVIILILTLRAEFFKDL